MFIQSSFIRKNTKELKEKLNNLGYKFRSSTIIGKEYNSLYCVNGLCFDCNERPSRYHTIIDCGTNEKLFLAIASMRSDTDKYQWFVDNKGNFFKCFWNEFSHYKIDDELIGKLFNPMEKADYNISCKPIEIIEDTNDWHKASVGELIEYFKDR